LPRNTSADVADAKAVAVQTSANTSQTSADAADAKAVATYANTGAADIRAVTADREAVTVDANAGAAQASADAADSKYVTTDATAGAANATLMQKMLSPTPMPGRLTLRLLPLMQKLFTANTNAGAADAMAVAANTKAVNNNRVLF
jgi:hypothetical protein